MDHAEEQDMEIQALEAIYVDDFKRVEEDGTDGCASFELTLVPETGADEDVNHVSVALRVSYPPTYPEVVPALSVRAVRRGGLTDELLADLESLLRDAAASEELLGTPMVYALAEKAQEWLVEHNSPEMDMHAEMMARLAAQTAKAVDVSDDVAAGDDADAKGRRDRHQRGGGGGEGEGEGTWRADGVNQALTGEYTAVTKESFAAWRADFDARRAAAAAATAGGKGGGSSSSNRKAAAEETLTGRQLFERAGATLIDTDAGALEEGEDDLMASREGAAGSDGDGAGGDGVGGGGVGGGAADDGTLLDAVGDASLFEEDEELPDDDEP